MATEETDKERLTKLEVEGENTLSVMKEFKKDFLLFKTTFTRSMVGLMVSIVMAAFYLGSYQNLPEDVAVLQEKVSWVEEQVILIERKESR